MNNGGDIAFHLAPNEALRAGLVSDLAAPALDGLFVLAATRSGARPGDQRPALQGPWRAQLLVRDRGLGQRAGAHRGRGGRRGHRSIGNAVDLPGHPAITRVPASSIDPDSDLGDRLGDAGCRRRYCHRDIAAALDAGRGMADALPWRAA